MFSECVVPWQGKGKKSADKAAKAAAAKAALAAKAGRQLHHGGDAVADVDVEEGDVQ